MDPLGKNKVSDKISKSVRVRLRQWHAIAAVWLVGVSISLPEYLMFRLEPFCYNNQLYHDCRPVWSESTSNSYTVL